MCNKKQVFFEVKETNYHINNLFLFTLKDKNGDLMTLNLNDFNELEGFLDFKIKWEKRIDIEEAQKYMQNVNPYIIPRNHQVQKAIDMAYDGDYSYFKDLNQAFKEPYSSNHETLMITPKENEIVTATFCGT